MLEESRLPLAHHIPVASITVFVFSARLLQEGTEKHTIFILTLIKKKKSIRVFMILVDFLLDKI